MDQNFNPDRKNGQAIAVLPGHFDPNLSTVLYA
jgi:hypothetical protein